MKKIIGIILSLAAVVTLSSFVIAHNVSNDKSDKPECISASDGWEYYKTVTAYYMAGSSKRTCTLYVWKKTVCGDPDYIISWSSSEIEGESSISKNYYYGKDQDWTTEYKYVTTNYYDNKYKTYFNCHLQGWD